MVIRSYFEPLLFLDGADPGEIQILAGVIHGGSPVAAAALGVDRIRKTGRIISIYTRPDMRRMKAATTLMQSLDILSEHYKLERMECIFSENMNGLDPFLRTNGYRIYTKKKAESCHMSDLLSNKYIRSLLKEKLAIRVRSPQAIERQQRIVFEKILEGDGYGSIGQDIDEEISLVAFYRGEPSAIILCAADHSGEPRVTVRLLVSYADASFVMQELLVEWLNVMAARYGMDAAISFYPINPGVSSFVHSLAAPKKGQQVLYGEKSLV